MQPGAYTRISSGEGFNRGRTQELVQGRGATGGVYTRIGSGEGLNTTQGNRGGSVPPVQFGLFYPANHNFIKGVGLS